MVLIEDAEASNARTQPGVVARRSFSRLIVSAYIHDQIMKELPLTQEITEDRIAQLAVSLSKRLQIVLPRQQVIVGQQHVQPQLVEPPPTQMLKFTNDFPAEIFTNNTVDLKIELVDIKSGKRCKQALAVPLKVKLFVVRGNFKPDDEKLKICKPLCPRNKATMPLLIQVVNQNTGRVGPRIKKKVFVNLDNGSGCVRVKITDNSSWVRSRMFKLVARVMKGSYRGRRIKEALSEPFAVKESKLAGRRKHGVPLPTDEPWRLVNVGKEYSKRLEAMHIFTVQDFLNKLDSDPDGLKRALGMQNMKWQATVEHARRRRVTQDQEVNVSNYDGNGMADSVAPNLGIQPEHMEDTSVTRMDLGMNEMNVEDSSEHIRNSEENTTISESWWNNLLYSDSMHAPEIQSQDMGMEEQRDPEAHLMQHSQEFPSLIGDNGPSEGIGGMHEQTSIGQGNGLEGEAIEGIHEQPLTGQEGIQSYNCCVAESPEHFQSYALPRSMPEFQQENTTMGEQVASTPNLGSDQMERFPSNTSFNGNVASDHAAIEGMEEHSARAQNFSQIYSTKWGHDYPYFPNSPWSDNLDDDPDE